MGFYVEAWNLAHMKTMIEVTFLDMEPPLEKIVFGLAAILKIACKIIDNTENLINICVKNTIIIKGCNTTVYSLIKYKR